MTTFIDALIAIFRTRRADALSDAARHTAFLFEKYRGIGRDLTPAQQAATFAWSAQVIATPVSDEDVTRLKAAVIDFIQQAPDSPHVGEAIWALGKLMDKAAKPALITALNVQLDRNAHAMYQAMIALDNIGEDVFGHKRSSSTLDSDEDRALAVAYLQRQGQM